MSPILYVVVACTATIGAITGWYIAVLHRRLAAATFDANHDPLTGLLNRRTLDAVMESAIASGRPFAAVLLDVDWFKSLNDRFGHDAGDAVLVELGHRLTGIPTRSASAPGTSERITHVFRLGGDEFLIIVNGDDNYALDLGKHIWTITAADEFRLPGGQHVGVNVSVGVASHRFGIGAFLLLRQADIALALAKAERSVARWEPDAEVPIVEPRPRYRRRDRHAAPQPLATDGPAAWQCRFTAVAVAPLAIHALRTQHHVPTDEEERLAQACPGGLAIIAEGGYVTAYSTGFPQPLRDAHNPDMVVYADATDSNEPATDHPLDRLVAHIHLDEYTVELICHAAQQDGLVEVTVRGKTATFTLTRGTGQHRSTDQH